MVGGHRTAGPGGLPGPPRYHLGVIDSRPSHAPSPRPLRSLLLLAGLLALAACRGRMEGEGSPAPGQPAPLSEVLTAPRPKGGEWFGVYLMGRKVGYFYSDLSLVPGAPEKARAVSEMYLKTTMGGRTSERRHREERVYQARPQGKLLSLRIEDTGDGGNQLLEGSAGPRGLSVVRKRPGQPNQILNLGPSREVIEDADQPRLALLRGQTVEGIATDAEELAPYRLRTQLEEPEVKVLGGVRVRLRRTVTASEHDRESVETFFAKSGEVVEWVSGQTRALAEPELVAKRLDQVEVLGLTRVTLPAPLQVKAHQVVLTIQSLPEALQLDSYRQRFSKRADGAVDVQLSAAPPRLANRASRPVSAQRGQSDYLRSSMTLESDSPEIQQLAHSIVGQERDAYRAAQKINEWVYKNLAKDYGASADRATDVLHQRRGDCTEHALLATSLLRAAGIPAKRVDGLVYLANDEQAPSLYWHQWVELYAGEWTQMDPTFGQAVADATHFAVGEEGNAEISSLLGQLKVIAVR